MSNAIFLSYASQDADAAWRICDALRAAGLEVWFDQSELRGGDAWDVSIRKQIKECALFVPVVSATTDARSEGYFRLEWKLAVDRSHLMADDQAFFFPVILGDTNEQSARVPDKFLERQWTRLGDETSDAAFANHIAKVVDGSASQGKNAPNNAPVGEFGALSKDRHSRAGGNPAALNDGNATRQQTRPLRVKLLATTGIGLAIAAALFLVQPWKSTSVPQPTGGSSNSSPEIKQLVAQVEDLIRDPMMATRENYVLADELMQRVLKAGNNNADYWVLAARISQMLFRQAYDMTPQKIQLLSEQVEKAARLDPDAIAVKELIARQHSMNGNNAEATRLANEILAKDPVNRVALSVRMDIARGEGRHADAADASAALQKLPGGDPFSLLVEMLQLARAARLYEAEKTLDQLLAISPTRVAYFGKMDFVKDYLADPLSAAAYVAQIPEQFLRQESVGAVAAHAFILSGRGDDALALLNRIPREFLSEFAINDPKGLFTGSAHEVARRPAAATAEWRNALALVEKGLANDASNLSLLSSKAVLQAMLEQKYEALKTLRLRTELGGKESPPSLVTRTQVLVRCGNESAAIAQVRTEWGTASFRSRSLLVRDLAHMPIYAKVRKDKAIANLIAEHYAFIKAARVAPTAPAAPATQP